MLLLILSGTFCITQAQTSCTNPVIWADVPDPDITRAGDTFYLISTTMHLMPGAPVMKSKDLIHWEIASYVFDKLTDTPNYDLMNGTVYGRGQWASSIRYHNGRFYALFSPNDNPWKSYIYTTTNPDNGDWKLLTRMQHFHDSSLFFDDDGRVYVFYDTGLLRELKSDLSDVNPDGVNMKIFERDSTETGLLEGSRAVKYKDKYYLLMISSPKGGKRRQVCYRADKITGPYEKKVILEDNFAGFGYVGQGCIIDDENDNWYGFIFQDRNGVGRVPLLMPCRWENGWPMLGDENGHVPLTATVPLQSYQAKNHFVESDDFTEKNLKLCWQWNHNPINNAWSLTERPGFLRLKTNRIVDNLYAAPNTLTQRMEGALCKGIVALDVSKMKDGDVAGFAAFNGHSGVLEVKAEGKYKYLTMNTQVVSLDNENGKKIIDVDIQKKQQIELKKNLIFLRIDCDFNLRKDTATFYYSYDNKQWTPLGEPFKMRFDYLKLFMGTKFAIFNYATKSVGGYVDVDFFELAVNPPCTEKYVYHGAGNPYLPLWEHLPDGEPRVFEDPDNPGKYRIYIIGSHDVRFDSYCGADIRMWSAPVEDLSNWRDEGAIFTYPIEGQWDVMYAPDLVEVKRKDGAKEYYLYPHSRGRNREAMVCKGSRPDGPFIPVNLTADGTKTLPGSILGFDPSVFIENITDPTDPDYKIGFRTYGYWGFQRSSAAQLDPNTMYSVRPGTEVIPYFMPASSKFGTLRDPQGTSYPQIYPEENLGMFNFFEASSIRKVGNKYVTIYSGYSGPDYGLGSTNSALRYAYGDSPLGPWKSGGVLVDSRAPVLNEDGSQLKTSNAGHNTHGSIEQINGQWYVFYHRPPRGFGYARQAMAAPIHIEWDEKPVAEGGNVSIRAYDPYSKNNLWTAKDSQGNEYKGAEVTSEGFHIFGLDPYQYYSAGIACYLSDVRLQQDSWDIWDNSAPLENVKNGNIIGYKYFGFGGLEKDKSGLKSFEGTKKGNKTAFNLFLTPKTSKAFKVNIWLDGPWDNDTWRGKKIGEIVVPANSAQETTQFAVDVSTFVDNLDKKHAIFLVAESEDDSNLFDLIGLGFNSDKKKIVRPVPPTVKIAVNGKNIELPATPARSTNENGITGYDIYEAVYEAPVDAKELPAVSASASDKNVKITITQAESFIGTAIVKFDYKNMVKTYRVLFQESKQAAVFSPTVKQSI